MITTRFGATLCTACGRWRDHSAGNCTKETAMKLEPTDSIGTLGPAAPKPAPAPQPQWKPTDRPGIQQSSDGKLRTDINPPQVVIQ